MTVTATPLAGVIGLPKTGQTVSYATGDDGELQKGVSWPVPRFTAGIGAAADCMTDNLTGLMWVASPRQYVNSLSPRGYMGWRLPNVNELQSLINFEESNNAIWLNGQGFSNVQSSWSATTYANDTNYAWSVGYGDNGGLTVGTKVSGYTVRPFWPVRAGQ